MKDQGDDELLSKLKAYSGHWLRYWMNEAAPSERFHHVALVWLLCCLVERRGVEE